MTHLAVSDQFRVLPGRISRLGIQLVYRQKPGVLGHRLQPRLQAFHVSRQHALLLIHG
ncbi:hypothetical protein [Deinococcus humi]|uniref:Uncharacterized protein n=1 Tax=Deinococcus humi TaxID=662880 RepID=A0A7W8JYM3_9DEIO|nr:hypothetical protein [Deinococcus humi]MBB5365380.1 hypothetical protein [Deinococcus humi]